VKIAAKIAVSVLLIWLLVRGMDIDAVVGRMFGVGAEAVVTACVILALLAVLQALRWGRIIRAVGRDMPFRDAFAIVLIGQFFNQTLPSSVGGDGVRMWRAHKLGLGLAAAVNSVLLDRLAAFLALILIVAVSLPVIMPLMGDGPERWAAAVAVAAGICGFALLLSLDRLPPSWRRWRAVAAAATLAADARRVFAAPRHAAPVVVASVTIHVGVSLAVYVLARALGIEATATDCLILVPPVLLFTALPISIAGWGVREGAMVTAFSLIGVPAADAFALSILLGLVIMAVGLPGGLVWVLTGGRSAATFVPRAAAEAEDSGA